MYINRIYAQIFIIGPAGYIALSGIVHRADGQNIVNRTLSAVSRASGAGFVTRIANAIRTVAGLAGYILTAAVTNRTASLAIFAALGNSIAVIALFTAFHRAITADGVCGAGAAVRRTCTAIFISVASSVSAI